MNFKLLIERILQENVQLEQLKFKWVGEGKPISEEKFAEIEKVCKNRFNFIAWLTKKVGLGTIKSEDVYKYEEYFDIFEKNKQKFDLKDIHQYKTPEEINNFIDKCIEIREKDIEFEDTVGSDNYVSPNDIEKLISTGGIKYYGLWNGYQVFRIHKSDDKTWRLYRDILGRCKGRGKGAKIEICTIADYDFFKSYLTRYRLSNYFLLYNLNDPKSPYQLHHESEQFMDKNDRDVTEIKNFDFLDFYKFVGEKIPKYTIDKLIKRRDIELPIEGEGWSDSNGKQGKWMNYSDGKKDYLTTYVNNVANGEFISFYEDGTIAAKGSRKGTRYNYEFKGDYSEYFRDGSVAEKGTYNYKGQQKGIWYYGVEDGANYILKNTKDNKITGFTGDGNVRYIGSATWGRNKEGSFTFFYPDGTISAKGNMYDGQRSRNWVFYDKKGNIIAKGRYRGGSKNGPWLETVTYKGKKYIIESIYEQGRVYPWNIVIKDKNSNMISSKELKNLLDSDFIYKVMQRQYVNTDDEEN